MNKLRYTGRRIKGGAKRLIGAAVFITKIALGVALGLLLFVAIAAPLITG